MKAGAEILIKIPQYLVDSGSCFRQTAAVRLTGELSGSLKPTKVRGFFILKGNTMDIRKISENDDLMAVSNVYEQSWKSAYKGIIPQSYLDSIPGGRWAKSVTREGMNNIVLTDGAKIVGTSCFCVSRWEKFAEYGEIVSVYLLPEYTGKGYGRQLMEAAVCGLKSMGYDKRASLGARRKRECAPLL